MCVSVLLIFFEPDHHEQFLYTPLQNKLRIKLETETFPKSFLLGDLDRRNIPMSFSSWRSWQKKHSQEFLLEDLDRRNNSQEFFLLKVLTETFPRVLFLKILTETFARVFFLKNLIRISASTQCLVAAENEKKEVRSLLLHAFHWWVHTPTPSVWPNQTTIDFFLLV